MAQEEGNKKFNPRSCREIASQIPLGRLRISPQLSLETSPNTLQSNVVKFPAGRPKPYPLNARRRKGKILLFSRQIPPQETTQANRNSIQPITNNITSSIGAYMFIQTMPNSPLPLTATTPSALSLRQSNMEYFYIYMVSINILIYFFVAYIPPFLGDLCTYIPYVGDWCTLIP